MRVPWCWLGHRWIVIPPTGKTCANLYCFRSGSIRDDAAMRCLLNIDDRSAGTVSTTVVTREQASAIIAMAPGDAVELDDGSAHYLGDAQDRDPLIEFVSSGVRPSARRSLLLPQLRAIQNGHGIAVD